MNSSTSSIYFHFLLTFIWVKSTLNLLVVKISRVVAVPNHDFNTSFTTRINSISFYIVFWA